ncbi:RAVE subunit 2/Rogdi [Podospora appendiculata]|uniref:RAVE subunit 2/Rogdi n=1 Tax=Podospora appendiculata TaxID=314037 RepID=A0AAE1CIP9_9PEZI|nr:RAVE subunit 2/Rogdi [Podospora appendiculata]
MSVEIWPPVAPDLLKAAIETSQKSELDWLVAELRETLTNLKHGLEDCYALLAPIDQGSTLVLSTPRNEVVKGHVTRVGTRIVKGTIHLRLRTLPHQTLTINPDHPIHLSALTSLNTLLSSSIDLLALTLSLSYPSEPPSPHHPSQSSPTFLSTQLRLLSLSLSESSSLLKGPPLTTADPSWTTRSIAPSHFLPQPTTSHHPPAPPPSPPPLSFHLGIQDSCLVLWLRSLEPANAPVNFSTKLALAIGTTRRLEHDESERIFGFCCSDVHSSAPSSPDAALLAHRHTGLASSGGPNHTPPTSGRRKKDDEVEVFVREKVRVESADPNLLSLSAKLTALGHTLALARRNLAAVMGEGGDGEEEGRED